MKIKMSLFKNRKLLFPLFAGMIAFFVYAAYGIYGLQYEDKSASYTESPAPWDGIVPVVSIEGKKHKFTFFIPDARYNKWAAGLEAGKMYALDQIPFLDIRSGQEWRYSKVGTLTVTAYRPKRYIAGVLNAKFDDGEETVVFSARFHAADFGPGFHTP